MKEHKAEIYYYDIGDYLTREEKLDKISSFKSMENLPFTRLIPNEYGDWIDKRNDKFSTWIPIGADKKKKFDNASQSFFTIYSLGCVTSRDSWVYNYSHSQLCKNIKLTITHYNDEQKQIKTGIKTEPEHDFSKGSWSRDWLNALKRNKIFSENEMFYTKAMYRPFCKQHYYFDNDLNEERYKQPNLFPTPKHKNLVICVNALGGKKEASVLISDCIVDYNYQEAGAQCFPLYWYETVEAEQNSFFANEGQIIRHDAISNFILDRAQQKYGPKIQKEDIFYYVYGILHSKSYRETFSADFKKMLPRIPLVSDWQKFWAFSKAGRELANLHLNYEEISPYPDIKIDSLERTTYEIKQPKFKNNNENLLVVERSIKTLPDEYKYYAVEQMKFPNKNEKDTICYNDWHTIKNIPQKAYEYVVNGKSAIEWVMERYAITKDKKSGITNNPNNWSEEHERPRYILDLLLSVINVSVKTVDIVNGLPEIDWEKE